MSILIIPVTAAGHTLAQTVKSQLTDAEIVMNRKADAAALSQHSKILFIGALGICVRTILPLIDNKYHDPAVVCMDSSGKYVISVLSGHVGGANEFARQVASIVGAEPVITTQSDTQGVWALDTIATKYGWATECTKEQMDKAIYKFVNGLPTALILDIKDKGTRELEDSLPANVTIYNTIEDVPESCQLIIAVSHAIFPTDRFVLYYRPKVLSLGVGCRKNCNPQGVSDYIKASLKKNSISPLSIKSVCSIDLKKDEPLIAELAHEYTSKEAEIYTPSQLSAIDVPNPSEKVKEVTGVWGVAESSAIYDSDFGMLLIPKQKCKLSDDSDFTFAVALDATAVRGGHIEIVGAGPGDPELVSVRGARFLRQADLILYAGSLVPRELTYYAKPGCVVRSSASMNLEEQIELMREFYNRGMLVVRLHTGDPCIYGAIQEQMAYFDKYGMRYHITPGISSFQAAAAALRSQFTIPEKVQTIILTRGEGRTPMPEKEQLHKLAASQSTMCIYLSAGIVEKVQEELLQAYKPETPVAACYKLTWKDEKIYRGQLKDLAKIVRDNNLTFTTLLVVGDAIDNRYGLSKLYDHSFSHLFRSEK
jgi:precorrin-4 C11-methyltransferase